MLFEHLGWNEVSERIIAASRAPSRPRRHLRLRAAMQGATQVSSSKFAEAIVNHM